MKEIKWRIDRTNEQRMIMAIVIANLMKSESVNLELRSSMAASMMDMLEFSMIPEDTSLIKLINDAITEVNESAKKRGVFNLIEKLDEIRKMARRKTEHESAGESILKSLKLDNLNLN